MRAPSIRQVVGLGLVLGLVAAPASARTFIDMPAPKGADGTQLPQARLGAVALNRYSYSRVTPLYSYRSPPVWPYGSYWRVGYPFGYGYGWGYGRGWGWGGGWGWRGGWGWGWRTGRPWGYGGRYVIGSRTLRGFRYRSARSRW